MRHLLIIILFCCTALSAAAQEIPGENLANQGIAYYEGKGVKQDYKEAVFYFKKASQRGHQGAIEILVKASNIKQ